MTDKWAIFKDRKRKRNLNNKEWWFVIEDAVLALIDSKYRKWYMQRQKAIWMNGYVA